MCRIIALFLLLILPLSFAQAAPLKPENVPQDLKPWINWALLDVQDYQCPFWYYNYQQKRCAWPAHLGLELSAKQGNFSSSWQVYKEDWVALPGGDKFWPQAVTANDKPVLVMNRQGIPMVKLNAGVYDIKGSFFWDSIPESLIIPQNSGVVDLSINGKAVAFPAIKDGAIWLKESDVGQKKLEAVENKWDLQVFRQVNDDVPLQLTTFLELEVSGQQREIKLPHALLAEFIPIKLQSPLPAKIEPDGSLSLQVRPGRWHIELYARHPKPVDAVSLKFKDKTWPESEIWVFNAQPYQRLVEVQNLQPVDPSQTNLPDEWKTLPAFQVLQGETMGLKVIRRGDPEPEPNHLVLNRELWLDFEGNGYTIQDNISGKMTNGWRLNALPENQLGQVKLNGENQLITQIAGSPYQGVEVRKGDLTLKADSRYLGDIGKMSAVGWEQSFHQVTAILRLPPGWRLLAVTGVDNDPNCWISNWTLLDLFLVLIAALAISHLWDIYWGGFALVCLALIWHEAAAPQYVWLNILVALALIKVLPEGKILKFVRWYRNACWLVLVLIVIPFLIDQVRMGIYPQLEKPWQQISGSPAAQADYSVSRADDGANMPAMVPAAPAPMDEKMMAEEAVPAPAADAAAPGYGAMLPAQEQQAQTNMEMKSKAMDKLESEKAEKSVMSRRSLVMPKAKGKSDYYAQKSQNFNRIDPNANVQTGLGSPQWEWNQVQLSWNGSVNSEQVLRFWYLSPAATMLLNFVRVIIVLVLSALMFGWEKKINVKAILPIFIWLSILPLTALPTDNAYADFPDQVILDQLKNRITEAPDCLPNCADIPVMKVAITPEKMTLSLQVHAQQNVALPLPARYKEWFPNQVSVDGKIATAMLRDESGSLWLNVAAGEHQVVMSGINPEHTKFTLPLPLKPHYVSSTATGWLIEGIHENGEAENQLQFNRVQTDSQKQNSKQTLEQGALPAFISIERTLELGLDWRLTTRINRVMVTDSAVLVELPLLKGESVTTPEVRVKNGKVLVSMSANQESFEWVSILEKAPQIELAAAQTSQWTEIWRADVSPIWHLQTGGISVVHHQDEEGYWLPEWRPWPGEKVTLNITRPTAIEGRTLTIDSSHLQVTPGKRSQDGSLELKIRSSKGTQHTITLPEKAELQSVLIDGVTQPIRQKGSAVTLPIKPGEQRVTLNWQQMLEQSNLLRSPVLNLGTDSVNSHINIRLGEDRWVLVTAGPRFGPAVLFWGVIVVITIVSVGLSKVQTTPLKHWQWFLLLIGLSQIDLESALIVIAWLIVLGIRAKQFPERTFYFNAMQIGLIFLTLISLSLLFTAVKQGLLGAPNMQIVGNQSSMFNLNWYQDRSGAQLPITTVISLPIMAYRVLMLCWSLWLAMALLSWLKWGWRCFSTESLWKERVPEKKSLLVEEKKEQEQK